MAIKTSTDSSTESPRCLGCRRPIRSAEALATGYGAGCRAKMRKAAKTADLSAWTPSQVEEARQAIEDGAVVPSNREGVFHVVSVDGSEVHLVHRCAVAIVLATSAPAPRPALAAAPVALPAAAPADDVWAELEALGALAGAAAPF